jgi:hypothetical protein
MEMTAENAERPAQTMQTEKHATGRKFGAEEKILGYNAPH